MSSPRRQRTPATPPAPPPPAGGGGSWGWDTPARFDELVDIATKYCSALEKELDCKPQYFLQNMALYSTEKNRDEKMRKNREYMKDFRTRMALVNACYRTHLKGKLFRYTAGRMHPDSFVFHEETMRAMDINVPEELMATLGLGSMKKLIAEDPLQLITLNEESANASSRGIPMDVYTVHVDKYSDFCYSDFKDAVDSTPFLSKLHCTLTCQSGEFPRTKGKPGSYNLLLAEHVGEMRLCDVDPRKLLPGVALLLAMDAFEAVRVLHSKGFTHNDIRAEHFFIVHCNQARDDGHGSKPFAASARELFIELPDVKATLTEDIIQKARGKREDDAFETLDKEALEKAIEEASSSSSDPSTDWKQAVVDAANEAAKEIDEEFNKAISDKEFKQQGYINRQRFSGTCFHSNDNRGGLMLVLGGYNKVRKVSSTPCTEKTENRTLCQFSEDVLRVIHMFTEMFGSSFFSIFSEQNKVSKYTKEDYVMNSNATTAKATPVDQYEIGELKGEPLMDFLQYKNNMAVLDDFAALAHEMAQGSESGQLQVTMTKLVRNHPWLAIFHDPTAAMFHLGLPYIGLDLVKT